MKKESAFIRIYRFYLEGFREMKLGKTLWLIILVKLFIMFFILRLFFFPNYLGGSICPYCHVSLALRATNTRTWRYPSYYGDDLLSDR